MVFKDDNAVINHIIQETKQKNHKYQYDDNQLNSLIEGCWKSLDEEVREAYRNEKSEVGEKKLNGLSDFMRSMDRLQDSFPTNYSEEAVSNFKFVDRSNHANEISVFDVSKTVNSLKNQKSLAKFLSLPMGVATQLSTLTAKELSDEDIAKAPFAMASILVGIVTDKNKLLHTRSIDELKISGEGKVHPDLIMAIGAFVQQNLNKLSDDEKELKRLGTSFKKELEGFDLDTGGFNSQRFLATLLSRFNEKFKQSNSRVSSLSINDDNKKEVGNNVTETPVVSKPLNKVRGL